jgi:quinol-cytochrome oxidoreductase complex cytochrome b subunit/mono/diheme cytochrome c family protein
LPSSFTTWLEDRTGLVSACRAVVREPLPGGARWRHVFGPALTAAFLVQLVTGLLLMSAYVPTVTQAWGSVWFIQTQMSMGWFIRGLHHFGSSAVVVLLALHLVQVVATRAYRAPREVNWWLGLLLMLAALGLALTGYLLPWDQKGYWAAKVATSIMGSTPGIGTSILDVIVGGSEYGNLTLTRLYAIHVGLLPLCLICLLVLHILLYYRHGASAPAGAAGAEPAWPGQVARNLTAAVVMLAIVVGVVLWNHGVSLEAPADPGSKDYPARPEWYFLSLFQMLNYFKSPYEVIGTHILPGLLFAFLAALPLLDRVLPRLVFGTACGVLAIALLGAGYLTAEAVWSDIHNPGFREARGKADIQRERTMFLAGAEGVPPDGAAYILQRDPLTHGRAVLEAKCLSCHYDGGRGQVTKLDLAVDRKDPIPEGAAPRIEGLPGPVAAAVAPLLSGFRPSGPARPDDRGRFTLSGVNDKGEQTVVTVSGNGSRATQAVFSRQSAADLEDFGTKAWVRGLLEKPSDPKYFGTTPKLKGMKTWKAGSKLDAKQLDDVADFVAELGKVEEGETFESWFGRAYAEKLEKHPGQKPFVKECGKCHLVGESGTITEGGDMESPNLFAYGSRAWLRRMIHNPADDDFYGYLDPEDQMPGFQGQLSENDLTTLVRYLQGDYTKEPSASRQ